MGEKNHSALLQQKYNLTTEHIFENKSQPFPSIENTFYDRIRKIHEFPEEKRVSLPARYRRKSVRAIKTEGKTGSA